MKICNLDTAQALQELGYDGYYNYIYAKNTESSLRYIGFKEVFELSEYTGPPAPRLDDAAYFLRDRYRIFIDLYPDLMSADPLRSLNWEIFMLSCDMCGSIAYGTSTTYDSALEAAIIKAIEIINHDK